MMAAINYNSEKQVSYCYSDINGRSFDAPDYVNVSNGRRRRVLMSVATNWNVSLCEQVDGAESKARRSGRTGTWHAITSYCCWTLRRCVTHRVAKMARPINDNNCEHYLDEQEAHDATLEVFFRIKKSLQCRTVLIIFSICFLSDILHDTKWP